jgi:hypothetical protein
LTSGGDLTTLGDAYNNEISLGDLTYPGNYYLTVIAKASGYEDSGLSAECIYNLIIKLSPPTELSISNKTLTWKAVTNATSYDVYLSYSSGGTREIYNTVTDANVDLSILDGSSATVFYFVVKALADGYITSDPSSEIVYNK